MLKEEEPMKLRPNRTMMILVAVCITMIGVGVGVGIWYLVNNCGGSCQLDKMLDHEPNAAKRELALWD